MTMNYEYRTRKPSRLWLLTLIVPLAMSAWIVWAYADELPGRQICRYDDARGVTDCHVAAAGENQICQPMGSLVRNDPQTVAHANLKCAPIVNASKATDQISRRQVLVACLAGYGVRGEP